MRQSTSDYDVLIIGGGPVGATAAIVLARAGVSTMILERTQFPRFHVGESFLPKAFELIRELGLEAELRQLPHVRKFGAEFAMAHSLDTTRISFDVALHGGENETFNIERASFDEMMLRAAQRAGAHVVEGATVKKVVTLNDGQVELDTTRGSFTGKYVLDASGQATLLGKQLGTRRGFPRHRKVAYFGHFDNVQRLEGRDKGHPTIVMCDEGWFWLIPLDRKRTSIGLVLDAGVIRQIDVPAHKLLAWGIARCPLVRDRTRNALFPDRNHVIADFSYTCAPYAGPGYFLLGDAAVFYDPIFSAGACLGIAGAIGAARDIVRVLHGSLSPAKARKQYVRLIRDSSSVFVRLVDLSYDHSFRELLLEGEGPLQVHRAIISVLAGHVFPRPEFAVRWRLKVFEWLVWLNRRLPLVPRQERFSLLASETANATVSGATSRTAS